jgi:hypothetical protein
MCLLHDKTYPMADYINLKLKLAKLYIDEFYLLPYRQLLIDLVVMNIPIKSEQSQLVDLQSVATP